MPSQKLIAAAAVLPIICGLSSLANADGFQNLRYNQQNLVADTEGVATTTDPLLINPWGLAFQPTGAFWVNDSNSGVATLYDGVGVKTNATFTIPPGAGGIGRGQPTGLVANPTKAFLVPGTTLPAAFIFATRDGTISAWSPNLPTNPTTAVLAVDNSTTQTVYTGMDFGITRKGGFLYAADVAHGRVDVFDSKFAPANASLTGKFADPAIPAGFAPFNVRNIDGNLIVTYAKQNGARTFVTPGEGLGFVDEFDTDGNLIKRGNTFDVLNAPWGVARAPDGFGGLSGEILIGNFGDGHVFGLNNNLFPVGVLLDKRGQAVTIPGLWSLEFGGGTNSSPDTLFATAGVGAAKHGLFASFSPYQDE